MDSILAYYNEFIALSKSNPAVAGILGIYIGGIITYLSRNLPSQLIEFIKSQVTVELILDRAGNSWEQTQIPYENFTYWSQDVKKYFSRTFSTTRLNEEIVLVSGLGVHLFIYKRRLYWYTIIDLDSSGSETLKKRAIIKTLGRNRKPLEELFSVFKDIHLTETSQRKYTYILDSYWSKIRPIPDRTFDSIFVNKEELDDITNNLDIFLNSKDEYDRLGIPHRYTLMLEGPTGTGKTSIIKGLANKYNRNLYVIKPYDLISKGFINRLSDINNGFLVIEDIDSLAAISSRGDDVDEDKHVVGTKEKSEIEKVVANLKGLDDEEEIERTLTYKAFFSTELSTVLNILDGIIEISNLVIIMTTNKIGSIDKAMLRPGRVDRVHHIGWLNRETIVSACNRLTGLDVEEIDDRLKIDYISGANLMNRYMLRKDNYHFIDSINEIGIK